MEKTTANSSTVEINLLGQRILLKTSETDPELIQEVLRLVTLKLGEAEARVRGAAPYQTALIALMDLAEEYIKAKQRTVAFKTQVNDKSSQLLSLLENEFK